MAKTKSVYFCSNCGNQSSKWTGRCSECGEWNTFVEEIVQKETIASRQPVPFSKESRPLLLDEISVSTEKRINTLNGELNRVLGGGLVWGSLVLLGGEPGIGKSTLMLQIALKMSNLIVLYVTGEESEQQIKMRAERLGLGSSHCYILTETNTQAIFKHIAELKPQLVIIDSVQTLFTNSIESSAGSISQVRECAHEFQKYTKLANVPVILIGHITKDGIIAGPKILEHMVDTVIQFEGDRNHGYRLIRAVKNRFGSSSELGIYEMQGNGLREVVNPSEILITQHDENLSGIAIAATMEGMRPMLVETQALVSSAAYGTPQRSSTGFDIRRMNMLLAVLEKKVGFRLGAKDVFLNIAGGLKVSDPAIDLAVVAAVLSSNEDSAIGNKVCFSAEVGLSGEIRPVNKIDQRIGEAAKLGFQQMFVSKFNLKGLKHFNEIEIIPVSRIQDLYTKLFH